MSILPKLLYSSKIKIQKGVSPIIKNDNATDIGKFTVKYLSAYSQYLPVYESNAAALIANENIGTMYLYNDGTATSLAFVVAAIEG